jgi:hypothetical protein
VNFIAQFIYQWQSMKSRHAGRSDPCNVSAFDQTNHHGRGGLNGREEALDGLLTEEDKLDGGTKEAEAGIFKKVEKNE